METYNSLEAMYKAKAKKNQAIAAAQEAEDAAHTAIHDGTDPIAAFDAFIVRNFDQTKRTRFFAADDNDAELVRRAIRAALI